MAYRLKFDEAVPQGVKRIADEEIALAIQHLRGKAGRNKDQAVHETRKSIKKIRALLRLVSPAMRGPVAAENRRLRDAGRKISALRDAGALLKVFDDLQKGSKGALGKRSLAPIRQALLLHKRRLEETLGTPKAMRTVAAALARTRQFLKHWQPDAEGFSAIQGGLERTYRDGKQALAKARKHGRREDFHEWRKRVKDHWYHLRLLDEICKDAMPGYEHSLKDLEDALGEDLNLAILRKRVLSLPQAKGLPGKALIAAVESARKRFRERALAIGDQVYAEKPRHLTHRILQLWEASRQVT